MKNPESTKSAKEMTILGKYFCHLIAKFKINSFFFSSIRTKRSYASYFAHCNSETHAMDFFEDFATFMNHHMDDNGWARLIKGQLISKHLIYRSILWYI